MPRVEWLRTAQAVGMPPPPLLPATRGYSRGYHDGNQLRPRRRVMVTHEGCWAAADLVPYIASCTCLLWSFWLADIRAVPAIFDGVLDGECSETMTFLLGKFSFICLRCFGRGKGIHSCSCSTWVQRHTTAAYHLSLRFCSCPLLRLRAVFREIMKNVTRNWA